MEIEKIGEVLAEAAGIEPARDNARRFSIPLPYQLGDASLGISDCGMSDRLQLVAGSVRSLFPWPRQAEAHRTVFGGRDRSRTCKRQRAVVFKTTALPIRLPFPEEISDCELRICIWCLVLRSWRLALCSLPIWQGCSDLNREFRFWRTVVCAFSLHP